MAEVVRQVRIKILETGEIVTSTSAGNGYKTAKIEFVHRSKVKFLKVLEGEEYVKPSRVFDSASARAKNSNLRVRSHLSAAR